MLALSTLPSTFEFRKNVTGDIRFDCDWGSFPSAAWSDLPVIIIGWWLERLARLDRAESYSEILSFMDGPYSVRVDLDPNNAVDLTYLHGDRVIAKSVSMPLHILIALVRTAGMAAVDACDKAAWSNSDLMNLRARLEPVKG